MSDPQKSRPPGPVEGQAFAVALSQFIRDHSGKPQDPNAPPEPVSALAASAQYLAPFVERLQALERDLPPFPSNHGGAPWAEAEAAALDISRRESLASLRQRFGLQTNALYAWAAKRRWKERRAVLSELLARRTSAAVLVDSGKALGVEPPENPIRPESLDERETRLIDLCELALKQFATRLGKEEIDFKNGVRDLDVLARLIAFLRGQAERIVERRNTVSVIDLERAAAQVARRMRTIDPALAGVVRDAEFRPAEDGMPSPTPRDAAE